MADDIKHGNDGPTNVEQTGYEFEKGRQQFRDERAAELEALEQEFKARAAEKGCAMMLSGLGAILAAVVICLVSAAIFEYYIRKFNFLGGLCLIFGVAVIPGVIALVGAFKFIAGCACAEDFTDPIEEEDPDRAG